MKKDSADRKRKDEVLVFDEIVSIPTYPVCEPEEMPMFSETANHQGTTGNPYPVRVVSSANGEGRQDKDWRVIRLENEYIRISIIPDLGGRIYEAYDKTTGYDFLYKNHVIKPGLIGVYGLWMSGGIEFNWPFHHRPSTVMPVDTEICREEDGGVVVWLSEHAPNDRTKGMVGIALRPDTSYFETRVVITNRTAQKHNFLWWENAAVAVHEGYRLVFPPDVTWVHHHNDASHTTFPIASEQYGADEIKEPKDISWHKNSRIATSYFSAPSRYDFFGGFDYVKNCGILHIADHNISPGKKMFTWGYGSNAMNWEKKLTDTDGQYAELMAGCYTNDQPDFTWIAPYETKHFSQYWYPTQGIGYTTCATLDAAISLDREQGCINVNVTSEQKGIVIEVCDQGGEVILKHSADMLPSAVLSLPLKYREGVKLCVKILSAEGRCLLHYVEEEPDYIHIPKNNTGTPLPDALKTPCELVIAGAHQDQYRSPLYKPDIYYKEALRKDPQFLPALKALGEFYTRELRFKEALEYLQKAWDIECRYNQNPEDGTVGYLRGICQRELGMIDEAYDSLYRAAWSNNVISPAMTAIAAIDGVRGDTERMIKHAAIAAEKEARHPLSPMYMALAHLRRNETDKAEELCAKALALDPLNHLARFCKGLTEICRGEDRTAVLDRFFAPLNSDPAQTVLDIVSDLYDCGSYAEAIELLRYTVAHEGEQAMLCYTLAYCHNAAGESERAEAVRHTAKNADKTVKVFPLRAIEQRALIEAVKSDETDGFAAYLLGCIFYNSRRYDEAAELWKKTIRYCPEFYIGYRNLALAYYNHLGRGEEAAELMKRAIALNPNDQILFVEASTLLQKTNASREYKLELLKMMEKGEQKDQSLIIMAHMYNGMGMYEDAQRVMCSHRFSPGEGAEFAVAEPYMISKANRGRIALAQGRYSEALEFFKAAQIMPENLNVGFWNESVMMPYRYYEAQALTLLGRDEEAALIIAKLCAMKDEGMWNMGGEFVYYKALSVRLGGDELRAQRIMRDAMLRWEEELKNGCTYHKTIGNLYNCIVGDGRQNRLSTLYAMLGYGRLFNHDILGAKEYFERSLQMVYSAKIAFELEMLQDAKAERAGR